MENQPKSPRKAGSPFAEVVSEASETSAQVGFQFVDGLARARGSFQGGSALCSHASCMSCLCGGALGRCGKPAENTPQGGSPFAEVISETSEITAPVGSQFVDGLWSPRGDVEKHPISRPKPRRGLSKPDLPFAAQAFQVRSASLASSCSDSLQIFYSRPFFGPQKP